MDVKRFTGVYPAVITPFDETGEVDTKKLTAYTEYLCGKVDGLFVGGSYGSGPIMTVQQRKTVAETVMSVAKGSVPVILMIGCTDTNSTIELAKHAQRVGADAVAAVTPHFKDKKSHYVSEDEWTIFENTHEAIIDRCV